MPKNRRYVTTCLFVLHWLSSCLDGSFILSGKYIRYIFDQCVNFFAISSNFGFNSSSKFFIYFVLLLTTIVHKNIETRESLFFPFFFSLNFFRALSDSYNLSQNTWRLICKINWCNAIATFLFLEGSLFSTLRFPKKIPISKDFKS